MFCILACVLLRLGVFWLTVGVNEAIKQGVSIETADAVMSKPVGIPKTGVFGLIDLVGIDLMPKLSESLLSSTPASLEARAAKLGQGLLKRIHKNVS